MIWTIGLIAVVIYGLGPKWNGQIFKELFDKVKRKL